MRVNVVVTQFDFEGHAETIIAEGAAILENNTLKYKEDKENAFHFVKFEEDSVCLERRCEISSETLLYKDAWGTSVVKSPYGDMHLKTKATFISKKKDEWIAEYKLFSENNEIFHTRLVWKIQYLA